MNTKQNYLILMAVIVVISFFFLSTGSAIINGKISTIKKTEKKIKKAQEKLNSAKVLNQQLMQVSKVIENALTNEKEYAPSDANIFVKQLADLADQYKIAVYGVFPRINSASANILEQQYSMEIECTYVQLGQLLSSLESLDQIVKINTIDVRPMGQDKNATAKEATHYKILLELSTFKIVKEA